MAAANTAAAVQPRRRAAPPADDRGVSVLLTYRQAGETIHEAIASVLEQSHPHLELLLVDDNDDDARQTAALKARIDDQRVRLLANPRQGRVHALRFAVDNAKHDICAIIDDDELWERDKLAWDLTVLDREHGATFVSCRPILFSSLVRFPEYGRAPRLGVLSVDAMLIRNRIQHAAVTCYRDLLRYDTRLPTSEDYELWLRLQRQGTTLYCLDQPRTGHRVHSSSSFLSNNLLRFYCRSAGIQLRYILQWRKYYLLLFPPLRVLYTLVRRPVLRFRIRRNEQRLMHGAVT